RITSKREIGMSPLQVVYGTKSQLSVTVELPILKLVKAIEDSNFTSYLEKRIVYLQKLDAARLQVVDMIVTH
ncbi:hypothetical protein KI387_017356, partial [Taxus chinensis]